MSGDGSARQPTAEDKQMGGQSHYGEGAKAMVRKMGKALNPRGSIETRQKAPLPGDGKVRSRIKNGDKISKRFRTQAANGKLVL